MDEKKKSYRGYTEARKAANAKYNSQFVEAKVRMTSERREQVKAFADLHGESLNAFITRLIDEAMNGSNGQEQAHVVEVAGSAPSVSPDYSIITPHIEKTGESVQAFVDRAIRGQIERDTLLIKMGMKVV